MLLSGAIPPNPTEILSSTKFSEFISELRNEYDYVLIDSAPTLLVSDSFEISNYADTTLYIVKSGSVENNIATHINECNEQGKLGRINLVLNFVGNSSRYGYKYNYQYGYKYKYAYNYGYGYGYGAESDK